MESRLIEISRIPRRIDWKAEIKKRLIEMNGAHMGIEFVVNRQESVPGLLTAWYRLCSRDLKRRGHSTVKNHQLGATVYLYLEGQNGV